MENIKSDLMIKMNELLVSDIKKSSLKGNQKIIIDTELILLLKTVPNFISISFIVTEIKGHFRQTDKTKQSYLLRAPFFYF